MLFGSASTPESETRLKERASAWPQHSTLESLTDDTLRQIALSEGVDFATALLFARFQNSPERASFMERINALLRSSLTPRCGIDAKVVIVPGALYVERPDMGGDGRLVREIAESFGLQTELIPLASVGSLTTNARIIRIWLEQHQREPMILVSLSKGGADLKMTLADPDAANLLRDVVAWVNVCGPLNGSRMANWILANRARTWFFRWKFRWQKRDFQFVTDLRHGEDSPLAFRLRLPPSMRVLSLIGFPLRGHMTTRLSRSCHRTLARWGPNDGTTSLADLHEWPGEIYPAWGMDHYFRPEAEAKSLIAAVIHYLSEERSSKNTPQPCN